MYANIFNVRFKNSEILASDNESCTVQKEKKLWLFIANILEQDVFNILFKTENCQIFSFIMFKSL